MFNYAPHPRAVERARVGGNDNGDFYLQYHQLQKAPAARLRVFADRDVAAKGEQLCEDYGDNTNAIYLEVRRRRLGPSQTLTLPWPDA